MTETTDEPGGSLCADTTPRDRRHQLRWLATLAAWAVLYGTATHLILFELVPAGPLAWLTAALPSALALVVVGIYGRYLRHADELQRMIHLQALAVGFGAGWVAMSGYPLFERLGAPPANAGAYILVMVAGYVVGSLAAAKRYR